MVIGLIGTDWDDTLKAGDGADFFEYIGMKMLSRSLPRQVALAFAKNPEYRSMVDIAREADGLRWRFHPLDAMRLKATKDKLRTMKDQYKTDGDGRLRGAAREAVVRGMYGLYNREVIAGLPVDFIFDTIDEYASEVAVRKLDNDALRAIAGTSKGIPKVIISSAYMLGILGTLGRGGWGNLFSCIVANRLERDGDTAIGFTLDIYGRKADDLIVTAVKYGMTHKAEDGIPLRGVAYVGNDPELDGSAMALVEYPVVSLLASDEDRQEIASNPSYGRRVRTPRTGEDLKKALTMD
jgi:hypothetical protein